MGIPTVGVGVGVVAAAVGGGVGGDGVERVGGRWGREWPQKETQKARRRAAGVMGNYWQYNTMPKATCAGLLIEGGSKSKGPPWAPGFVLNAKLGAGKLREGEEFVICYERV